MKESELYARARRRREVIARKKYAAKVEMTPQEIQDALNETKNIKSIFGHPTNDKGEYVGKAGRTISLIEKWMKKEPIPVGEQFRDFIKRELSRANYIWGHDEAIQDTALDISYNFGFDPLDVIYVKRAGLTRAAASVYNEVEFPAEDSVFAAPEEHSRYCPEHPGIMITRKSDGVYYCPMNDDGSYSYNEEGGHEVIFEIGAHQGNTPSMNASRFKKPLFEDRGDIEIVEKDKYDTDKLYSFQRKLDKGFENTEQREQVEELSKTSSHRSLTRKAQQKTDNMSNLFGPVQKKTRFCPDHPDVQVTRIADNVYQCPIDGVVYDWNLGFKKQNGEEVPGASVAGMTPDIPEYYS